MTIRMPLSVAEAFPREWLPVAEKLRQGTVTSVPHDRILAIRLADALNDGAAAMTPTRDDDPVWDGTAFRSDPGLGDLFVQHCAVTAVSADPDNDVARWLAVSLRLYLGDNDFAVDLLNTPVERDVRNIRWLVAGAMWVLDLSGVDSSDTLRQALARLSVSMPNFASDLSTLTASSDNHECKMAQLARLVLEGQRLSALPGPGAPTS